MMKLHFDEEQNPAYFDGFMTQEEVLFLLCHCFFILMRLFLCHNYLHMFSSEEMVAMLAFYEEEHIRVSSQLKHIEHTIRKLRGKDVDSKSGVILTRTGSKAKKRGPKSVWGKFILEHLRAVNSPTSYKSLIEEALTFKGLDSNHFGIIRASILNSAFRLRSIQGKVATVGQFGKKEKYLVLTEWLDKEGELLQEHRKKFIELSGGEPERVDVSTIPRPRYNEDLL